MIDNKFYYFKIFALLVNGQIYFKDEVTNQNQER